MVFSLSVTVLNAQDYDPTKVSPKALKLYEKAIVLLQDGYISDAVPVLQQCIAADKKFADAYLSLAGAYGELKRYAESVATYEQARKIDTIYFNYYYLPYSINLAGLGQFAAALDAVNRFLTIPGLGEKSLKSAAYRRNCYQFALDQAAVRHTGDYTFNPENLGDSINSPMSEYYPSFTIDDSTLVFTRRGEGIRENFIISQKIPGGYTRSALIGGSLNVEPSKGAINISQDGEWLIFAGNFTGRGFGNFDIYFSYNTPQGWSEPVNAGPTINTEFWESSPGISPDRNALYFSSDRPGGYGGKDLYVSYRQVNGKWSAAQNMGPLINTKGDELAPCIHADNNTLYYTSNGLPGYGGTDLYCIRKDAGGKWGAPENLGYPVNTIENEGSLFVASDGITAYYASDRADSRGALDLYRFQLPEAVRPAKTLYVQGTVYDAVKKQHLPCSVELIDNATQQPITVVQTDETGFYFVPLPVGKDYTFTVNRKGYLFYSEVYALSNKTADSTYIKDIPLQPIVLNAKAVLNNIQFELNAATLLPVSMIELDKLLQLMQDNPDITVQLNGHTDNTGTAAANQQLSLNRANAVKDYLAGKGIAAERILCKGFGAAQPIADNATEEGRKLNRRTEFIITGM